MSKVKMPDPVAYAHITDDGFIRMWSKEKTNLLAVTESIGKEPSGFITTDQAEAYANARVREALEEAANLAMGAHDDASPLLIAAAIRALIPQEGK